MEIPGWFGLRLAARSLCRSPTFTATAVLTLALGIGGSTAIFSLVDAVLLRPLPYRDPSRLVRIWEAKPSEGKDRFDVSAGTFVDWRQRARSFDDLALFSTELTPTVLATPNGSLQIHDTAVTANLFPLLGVPPMIGASFSAPRERAPDAAARHEVLVSFNLWHRAFASDPAIVGRTISIEGRPIYVVIGVMPPGFGFPTDTELWMAEDLSRIGLGRRAARFYGVVGRLKAGTPIRSARADLEAISRQLAVEYPASNSGWTVTLEPLHDAVVGNSRLALLTLLGGVTCVLLVGCANVANLLLARGISRRRELAVRAALGATRGRLLRNLFIESLLLAAAGTAVGWLLSTALLPLLIRVTAGTVPRLDDARLTSGVLTFSIALSVLSTIVIGLVPAVEVSRADFQGAVQGDGERSTTPGRDLVWQRGLVAAEVGVSLVLVVGAVLLAQSVVRLRHLDLGFDPSHVVALDVRVPIFKFSRNEPYRAWFRIADEAQTLLARLPAVAGVESVAIARDVPLAGDALSAQVTLLPRSAGATAPFRGESSVQWTAFYHSVSPGYFGTMRIALVAGRSFDQRDAVRESQWDGKRFAKSDGVAIVSESTARRFWPKGRGLGEYLSTSLDGFVLRRQVVGISRDVRSEALRSAPPAEVYVPYLEDPSFAMAVLVRTSLPAERVAPALRREMHAIDPDLSAANMRMLDDVVTAALGSARFSTFIVGAFAGVALALSAIGVYGVVAFGVARRTREIGIRMALGADRSDIRRLFLRQALASVLVGVVLGAAGALALARLVSTLLFGVGPSDPVSFASSAGLLIAVALAASYLPMRAALNADPATALRNG